MKVWNKMAFGNLDFKIESLREVVNSLDSRVDLCVILGEDIVAWSKVIVNY